MINITHLTMPKLHQKQLLLLLRTPNLDAIPSLKTLIIYLSENNFRIRIVSANSDAFQLPKFSSSNNIKLILTAQRKWTFGIPTYVKLLYLFIKEYIRNKPDYIIGGDGVANQLLTKLHKLFSIQYINFLLEYPDLDNKEDGASIENAKYIITHDNWHKKFLLSHYNINPNKFLLLPNASFTPQHYGSSSYLHDNLNIEHNKKIILHSGGLGPWFMCQELARATESWSNEYCLVFHTSHLVTDSDYYKEIKKYTVSNNNVKFSTNPVPNDILDKLIASAYIGIAIYSTEILRYRAVYMGCAAGKIGNYLKCGVPVIATNVVSLSYIEDYKCGILINNFDEITKAIQTIREQYDLFSQNAHRCYKELWEPDKYLQNILKTLSGTED